MSSRIAIALMSALLAACSSQQVVTSTQIAGNLAVAKTQYQETRSILARRIATLQDAKKAAEWQALLNDADTLKAALEAVWAAKLAPTAADVAAIYASGATLYSTGINLVAPELASLPFEDQIRLRRFDATLRSLAAAYQSWLASPGSESALAVSSQGLELAKLAIQLGMAIL